MTGRIGVSCAVLERTCWFIAGLVAGEGSFIIVQAGQFADGVPRSRHGFSLEMAADDRLVVEVCQELLGFGSLRDAARRQAHWKDTVQFQVHSRRAIRLAVIPFFDRFLLPSHKREQFDAWREDFERYVIEHPKRWGQGPSPCSIDGCERPVRARGLCRSHYYRATGN